MYIYKYDAYNFFLEGGSFTLNVLGKLASSMKRLIFDPHSKSNAAQNGTRNEPSGGKRYKRKHKPQAAHLCVPEFYLRPRSLLDHSWAPFWKISNGSLRRLTE